MIDNDDRQNDFIDRLNRMVAESEQLTMPPDGATGFPNSPLALALIQQVLGRVMTFQGLLAQESAVQKQTRRSAGRPKGSRNKPKNDTELVAQEAGSVSNDEDSPPRNPRKIVLSTMKIRPINKYRAAYEKGLR